MGASLKIAWDDSLCSGHRAIDVQHKYLLDIINELAEAIENGKAAMSVKTILNLLKYYTEWHFEREELCMDRHQCPAGEANKKAHGHFLETFVAFENEYRQSGGSDDIALRMYRELTAWLVNHIKGIDGQMADCVHHGPTRD